MANNEEKAREDAQKAREDAQKAREAAQLALKMTQDQNAVARNKKYIKARRSK